VLTTGCGGAETSYEMLTKSEALESSQEYGIDTLQVAVDPLRVALVAKESVSSPVESTTTTSTLHAMVVVVAMAELIVIVKFTTNLPVYNVVGGRPTSPPSALLADAWRIGVKIPVLGSQRP
jgi:hypothetical protein